MATTVAAHVVAHRVCRVSDRGAHGRAVCCIHARICPPSPDRLLTPGDVQVAEAHLHDFGFDPGPVDGIFTAQTQAAVRAFQRRYGLPVSGLLDRSTRLELIPGLDPIRKQ
jgi:murein L,D-transpeptidase YcbB/YkuD